MTAQIVEIAGHRMAVLPADEYERLVEAVEDKSDAHAAAEAQRRRQEGEEYLPAEVVDRILSGESPLRVWRQYRGFTLADLAKRVGIAVATVSRLETGKMQSHPTMWRALAEALDVSVEDILPPA